MTNIETKVSQSEHFHYYYIEITHIYVELYNYYIHINHNIIYIYVYVSCLYISIVLLLKYDFDYGSSYAHPVAFSYHKFHPGLQGHEKTMYPKTSPNWINWETTPSRIGKIGNIWKVIGKILNLWRLQKENGHLPLI